MHVYTFFACIHPPTHCPHHLPLSLVPTLFPGQDLFWLLFSNFVEEKGEKEKHDIFVCLR
jgi:hypothetical protein